LMEKTMDVNSLIDTTFQCKCGKTHNLPVKGYEYSATDEIIEDWLA